MKKRIIKYLGSGILVLFILISGVKGFEIIIHGNSVVDLLIDHTVNEDRTSVDVSWKGVVKDGYTIVAIQKDGEQRVAGQSLETTIHENGTYKIIVYYVQNDHEAHPENPKQEESVEFEDTITEIQEETSDIKSSDKSTSNSQIQTYSSREIGDTEDLIIDETSFPDEEFRAWIKSQSYGSDGKLTPSERRNVTMISLPQHGTIKNLDGIEYFTELTHLYCSYQELNKLDLSKNTKLEMLECFKNQLTSLDLSQNINLDYLYCSYNNLTELNVDNNPLLTDLYCENNQLTALDVKNNIKLKLLRCSVNKIESLDIKTNVLLEDFECANNKIKSLDISHNPNLTTVYCYTNELETLTVGNLTKLDTLFCQTNKLKTLDVSACISLKQFWCGSNQLRYMDMSNCTKLTSLSLGTQQLGDIYLDHGNVFDLHTLDEHINNDNITQADTTAAYHTLEGTVITSIGMGYYFYYDIDCGFANKTMRVGIIFRGINDWKTPLSIENWRVGETPQQPKASAWFGDNTLKYQYAQTANGEYHDEIPNTAGTWYVKASVTGATTYAGLESDPVMFTINAWTSSLKIDDWSYGEKAKTPTIEAAIGTKDVHYVYSNTLDGTYSEDIPTEAGSWYVKAILHDTDEYKGLESQPTKFQIHQAKNHWIQNPSLDNWTYGINGAVPQAKAAFGTNAIVYQYSDKEDGLYTSQKPNRAGIWYMKAYIQETANYEGLEMNVRFEIIQPQVKIEETDTIYIINSGKNMVFVCSGLLPNLTGVYIDGNSLDQKNYILESGSTILTLKENYLNGLDEGWHVLQFVYGNTKVETRFMVQRPIDDNTTITHKPDVNTGDSTNRYGLILLFGASLVALNLIMVNRHKKKL